MRELQPGHVISGRYRILRYLAEGRTATVYEGLDLTLELPIAIKVLRASIAHDDLQRARLGREMEATRRVRHPHVVAVHDFGVAEDGTLFLVMEMVHGQTLRQLVDDEGVFEVSRALHMGRQLALALQAIHEAEFVHRDLKLSNVMVARESYGDEFLKILDFGLARSLSGEDTSITTSGVLVGSAHFMAPEQAEDHVPDKRADFYSLGVMFYVMLTGRFPFDGTSPVAIVVKHIMEEIPPMGPLKGVLDGADVEEMVRCLMAKDKTERPASATEVLKRIEGCLALSSSPGLSVQSSPPNPDQTATVRDKVDELRTEERLESVLEAVRREGNRHTEGLLLADRGRFRASRGRLEGAETDLRAAVRLLRAVGDASKEATTLEVLARIEMSRGDSAAARNHLRNGLDLLGGTDGHMETCVLLCRLGQVELLDGQKSAASAALDAAEAIADVTGATSATRVRNEIKALRSALGASQEDQSP